MGLPSLKAWGAELSNLKMAIVTGAHVTTNMALPGAKVSDVVLAAVDLTTPGAVSELPKVTSSGNLQFATLDTMDAKKLLIVYLSAV
jgi:hypothetical protein